ncbi:NADPH-dependent FMN reductase [Shewanella amazonensis]|uniref:Azoreductase, putative n=1 Tax=Shewanella amazonensis (strain ATCC BAA-1098 / SB2B) TaxID=326297 RepID=A1S9D3_SHEAM|nr:NAD(P)H-dependent oxidoreductase [Shewanella amazonensis]ABM00990.1 azoreductase, putative [Shewanella amazonensis SB2B]
MKLSIINGSQRRGSQSGRVAEFIKAQSHSFSDVEVIDLADYALPFWDGDSHESKGEDWAIIEAKLSASDAYVLITPEWSGMATPVLKQLLMNASVPVSGHKPALLVSVSSSVNGVFPLSELMVSGNKNNKMVFIPANLIVRNVEEVLHPVAEGEQSSRDKAIRERIAESVALLGHYTELLLPMRQYRDPFRYGM